MSRFIGAIRRRYIQMISLLRVPRTEILVEELSEFLLAIVTCDLHNLSLIRLWGKPFARIRGSGGKYKPSEPLFLGFGHKSTRA